MGAKSSIEDPQVETVQAQTKLYARDLRKMFDAERLRSSQLEAANRQLQAYAADLKTSYLAEKQRAQELERAYHETLICLVKATRFRDQETGAHIIRLGHYAKLLATRVGWDAASADLLAEASAMHDVGKIGVPDSVLLKPGPLDPREWELLKKHTEIGASLLRGSSSPLLQMASDIAWTHHERWDGSGYPRGLRGEEIPECGRIVMLVDHYDALRTSRPYKPALTHERACQIMLEGDGRTFPQHFDPRLLAIFRDGHREFEAIYERHRD